MVKKLLKKARKMTGKRTTKAEESVIRKALPKASRQSGFLNKAKEMIGKRTTKAEESLLKKRLPRS